MPQHFVQPASQAEADGATRTSHAGCTGGRRSKQQLARRGELQLLLAFLLASTAATAQMAGRHGVPGWHS